MKGLFYSFKLKDLILVYLGKALNRILIDIKYLQYYLPLTILIDKYSKLNYSVKAYKDALCLIEDDKVKSIKYLIRPFSSDQYVFDQVIIDKEYKTVLELATRVGGKVDVVIDAGSNVGYASLYLSNHLLNPKIICIEADINNFAFLKRNIEINNLSQSIFPLHAALWIKSDEILEVTDDFRDGSDWSRNVKKVEADYFHQRPVKSISLEGILQKFNLDIIDILKIDIEGTEKDLFDDQIFMDCLVKFVKIISLEIHEEISNSERILTKLREGGFEINFKGETVFGVNKGFLIA
jgi:FkbM family methyltransferase